jgi:glutamate synthase domain-containing protein 3
MLRGLKLTRSFSVARTRNAIEWRENGNIIELILNFTPGMDNGVVYVLGEDTTFKELVLKDYFKNTQFKFPKDFNPETSIKDFLLKEATPLTIELRNEEKAAFLNNRAKYASSY